MPDIADRRIIQPVPVTSEYTLSRARSFWKGQKGKRVTAAEIDTITAEVWRLAAIINSDPCLCFDQISVETNNGCFTGSVPASAHNPAGIGALTNSSEYIVFDDWETGILAYFIHLLAWLGRLDLAALLTDREPISIDPRVDIVAQVRASKGEADTWRSLGGRWAVEAGIPWQAQATMTSPPNYGKRIASRHALILATADTEPAGQTGGQPVSAAQAPPSIQILSTPNYGYPRGDKGRNGHAVEAILVHIMDGTWEGTKSHFGNPATEASSNYAIAKSGTLGQYVDPNDSAWANGAVNAPDLSLPWLRAALAAGVNLNEVTESIELEGRKGELPTEPQYQSLVKLLAWRLKVRKLPADRVHVTGHYVIDSINRPDCPGRNFPWDRLMHDLTGTNLLDSEAAKSAALLGAHALGRKVAADAGAPDPYGLTLFEATVDLTSILPTLPKNARALACEKAVLWVGGAGSVDTFHRGQFEQLETAGKVQKWV